MQINPTFDQKIEFRRAAAQGNTDKVKAYLEHSDIRFINETSSNGNTALHWSIINQHYSVTKLLLTIPEIQLEKPNRQGHTPLHLAAIQGHKETVIRLLNQGVGRKDRKDNKGFSPLDYAYEKNNSFIVTKLKDTFPKQTFKDEDKLAEQAYEKFKINNPALIGNNQIFDLNYFFNEKISSYFQPGNKYSLSDFKKAIAKKTLDPHKLFVCGNLLQSAAVSRLETLEKLRWLLEQGVNPNLQASHELNPSSYKNTALHTLIANEDEKDALEFIDQLLIFSRNDFNFNLTDSEGKTCVCLAVKVGLTVTAKKLISLKSRVNINIPDEDGNTPLHYALLLGHVSIAKELIKNQSDETIKNKENKTAYELLNTTDIEDVRDCLETIWINPERKTGNSKKTYIQQCMENRLVIADYSHSIPKLIASTRELAITQKRKNITFLVAAATGDLSKLQESCDDSTLNVYNSKGNTALHLACEKSHAEIVKFLFTHSNIDLEKKNNENKKAVELIQDLALANLYKTKLLACLEAITEDRKDTLIRLAQCTQILNNEKTKFAIKNH